MACELDITKVSISFNVKYETFLKLARKYKRDENEQVSAFFVRVLDSLVKDVKLSAEDMQKVVAFVEENYKKRMDKRAKKAARSGDASNAAIAKVAKRRK